LVFVAQDEVELVFVSWTFPSCFGALIARWLGFVALDGSQYHIILSLWTCRLEYTLIRRVRHIWQPLEGFPQYTIFDTLAVGCWKDGGGGDSDLQSSFQAQIVLKYARFKTMEKGTTAVQPGAHLPAWKPRPTLGRRGLPRRGFQ
jgi:hypothetical protein